MSELVHTLPDDWTDLDWQAVNTARLLAADAVQKVGNGHPGTAMSLAPAAYQLFQREMRHNPLDTTWLGRDRFVLSCGHSSLTLYLQLFLGGFGLELDDLKSLRTWGSLTPGHPEFGHTRGVETTTGPLGQGVANAIGMAMEQRRLRGLLDPEAKRGESPFDYRVFAICSDGDLEEGVSGEASSIAGTQRLGNLTLIWDDNHISIEDDTVIAFNEDVAKRYEAYGWHVQTVEWVDADGRVNENVQAFHEAIQAAVIALLFLGESLSLLSWAGIALSVCGVLTLSFAGKGFSVGAFVEASMQRGAWLGVSAGFCFAICSIFIKSANIALEGGDPVLKALVCLVVINGMQTAMQGAWLLWREPGEVRRVFASWKDSMWVGALSASGSACWFSGFALAPVAMVRAVGQVEILFTLLASRFYLKERTTMTERVGALIVVSGVVLVLLGRR